jgi:hypothetical protein
MLGLHETWREPCDSVACDHRLVPFVRVVLAAGHPGSGSLAVIMAIVAALSCCRHFLRRSVRVAASRDVSARTHLRISRQFRESSLVDPESGMAVQVMAARPCFGRAPEVQNR